MARSHADEILEGWKMVAHSASRPVEAPRAGVSRAGIPVGMLAAAAIVAIVLVALASGGLGRGPQASPPAVGGSPTSGASAAPSPTSSPSPTAAASTGASPTQPAQTPSPAEVSAARDAIDRYIAALVRGDYPTAWAMLAPEAQTAQGSLGSYTSERGAYFKSVAGRYTVVVWPTDVGPITDWLPATGGASIDLRHAVLIEVDYPALAGNNAGYEVYIVSPGASGLEIFSVR